MQRDFHLHIQQHTNNWYTVSLLTHPEFAVFGPDLNTLREEIRSVVAEALSTQKLICYEQTYFEDMERRVVELELAAVQHNRLIRVPMRFAILVRPIGEAEDELFEVRIPKLQRTFRIHEADNIVPWSEETIKGFFHLDDVETLLKYDYERGERIETLEVSFHGKNKSRTRKKGPANKPSADKEALQRHNTPLGQVGVELTEEARQDRLPRAHFRDKEVAQVLGILESGQNRSLLLTGASGAGKTALIHEVVHRIAQGKVSHRLQEIPVWHVTGSRIIAGMKFLGEWQERCLSIIHEIRNERGILFVDNLLELMLAGSQRSGLTVAQLFLPYIQSGEITVIAESTPDALLLAEQRNAAFVRALRRLPLTPFNGDESFQILELAARGLEKEHKVEFSPESLNRTLDVLARFGDADALPGSGLTLLEQMARLPQEQILKGAAGEGEKLAANRLGRPVLQPNDAIRAFSRASGFPESLINPDDLLQVGRVRSFFDERIKGQPDATELLTNLVTIVKSSLNDPQRPLGSFFFMGPTGVGKTESALTLAEYLFGDRDRLVRFDMSEYGYAGSAARLVGGSRGEGDLTRKVREQPFCVLLLDELEKAHPEVFDILLQVLGEGRLTDGTGRTVRFQHTIIIMTSNLGAGKDRSIGLSSGSEEKQESLARHYQEAAQTFFRPEFINRVDFLVPFRALTRDSVRDIARRMLRKAIQREGFARRGIEVRFGEEVLDLLMKHGFNPKYGARPMRRAVEQHVLIPLSRRLVLRAQHVENEAFDLYIHQNRVAVHSSRGIQTTRAPTIHEPALQHDNLWRRYLQEIRARLQEWEESALIRHLRALKDTVLLPRLVEARQKTADLDEEAQRAPSTLQEDQRNALRRAAQEMDEMLFQLEWDLGLHQAPERDEISLTIEVPSLLPPGLKAAQRLAAAWKAWGETRSLTVEVSERAYVLTVLVKGPRAFALLQQEIGLHRMIQEEQEVDILVAQKGQNTDERAPVVREIREDPASLWDASTGQEVFAELSALHLHLDAFILARICQRLRSSTPSHSQ